MTRHRAITADDFRRWPEEHREAWRIWAKRCGFDLKNLVLPNIIEADDEARTVTANVVLRNPDGTVMVRPVRGPLRLDDATLTGPVGPVLSIETAVERKTIQLESPALPFPEERECDVSQA